MSQVVIFGSAHRVGKTYKIVTEMINNDGIEFIDLRTFKIQPIDEETIKANDDFIPLMEKLVTYDTWIIATPVYWSSMSTYHKIFFDRFTDFLTSRKDLKDQLRGKKLFVIASFGGSYPRGFEETFEDICKYLGIIYLGSSFVYSGAGNLTYLNNNIAQIQKAKSALDLLG